MGKNKFLSETIIKIIRHHWSIYFQWWPVQSEGAWYITETMDTEFDLKTNLYCVDNNKKHSKVLFKL